MMYLHILPLRISCLKTGTPQENTLSFCIGDLISTVLLAASHLLTAFLHSALKNKIVFSVARPLYL